MPLTPGKPVLVVRAALAVVRKDLVRLRGFLELFLGILVTLVAVRVILDGQLPVGFLYLVTGCALRDAQNLVVVSFCHDLQVFCFSSSTTS